MQTADAKAGTIGSIENFAWMFPWLARGAQPRDDDYRELEQHGISCIVNLRLRDESADVHRLTRRATAIQYPVPNDFPPTEEQALRWLDFCAARPAEKKVFIHCHAGHGRTSTFCLLLQIVQGDGDVDKLVEEERKYGFDPQNKHKKQYDFLKRFERRMRSGEIEVPKL